MTRYIPRILVRIDLVWYKWQCSLLCSNRDMKRDSMQNPLVTILRVDFVKRACSEVILQFASQVIQTLLQRHYYNLWLNLQGQIYHMWEPIMRLGLPFLMKKCSRSSYNYVKVNEKDF